MNPTALRTMVNRTFLTDSCTVLGRGSLEFDPDTLLTSDEDGAEVFTGACRAIAGGGSSVDAGDVQVPLGSFDVRLSWDTTGIEVGMVIVIDSSSDPHMVGRRLVVTDVMGGTDNAYRRVICQDARKKSEVGS